MKRITLKHFLSCFTAVTVFLAVFTVNVPSAKAITPNTGVSYSAYVQGKGWQAAVSNGESAAKDSSDSDSNTYTTCYTASKYHVGTDIPSGEYLAVSTKNSNSCEESYIEVDADSSGTNAIAFNTFTNRAYITVSNDQYLRIGHCKLYPADKAPKANANGGFLSDGQYKAGVDFVAGEYTLTSTSTSGRSYYEIDSDSKCTKDSVISKGYFDGSQQVMLSTGQYLKIENAEFLVSYTYKYSNTTKKTDMSDDDFQNYLNTHYGSYKADGVTVKFNWAVNQYQTDGYDESVAALLNSKQYAAFSIIASENRSKLGKFLCNMCEDIRANYPGKSYIGEVVYNDIFEDYPSGFDSSEIQYDDSLEEWEVNHTAAAFTSDDDTHYMLEVFD